MAPTRTRNAFVSLRRKLETDENLSRASSLTGKGLRALPKATAVYVTDKVPIFQWLPRYSYRWILNDVVAGITVGMLLIPQGLAYAKLANIPLTSGLMTCWIPPLVYAIMGTSKDISPGPTTIMGLLTAGIIRDLTHTNYSPAVIGGAVTFVAGIFSLAIGFLKLGFILNFVSIPVLSGFFSAAGLTIIFGQVPTLFGEKNIPSPTAGIIHDFFTKLPLTQWRTFVVGLSSIILLLLMQEAGKRWGHKSRIIWFITICRNAIVIILFTGISYSLNHHLKKPLWDVAQITKATIKTPHVPPADLIQKVLRGCITVCVAVSLEHLAIAKSFGRRNGYVVDESQELSFLGVSNFLNGLFATMPSGGAFSRTAVNSNSGVKTPLGGVVTSGFVLLSLYCLTGALYWVPKATLSAIIIVAVWHILIPVKTFYSFYRTSLADFIASMICFFLTLFISVEVGIASAVGFSVLHLLLRTMFTSPSPITSLPANTSTSPTYSSYSSNAAETEIPNDTQVFKPTTSILFPNAYRAKDKIMTRVLVYTDSSTEVKEKHMKLWNDSGDKHIHILRAKISDLPNPLPKLRVVILDLSNVEWIDVTGIQSLRDLKEDLKGYEDEKVEVRFLGMSEGVRRTFERAGWELVDLEGQGEGDRVFETLGDAIWSGRNGVIEGGSVVSVVGKEDV